MATCIAFGVRSTDQRRFERALELLKRAGVLLSRLEFWAFDGRSQGADACHTLPIRRSWMQGWPPLELFVLFGDLRLMSHSGESPRGCYYPQRCQRPPIRSDQ